jgi:hypothetical protein
MANGNGSARNKEIILATLMLIVTGLFSWIMHETIDTYGFKKTGDRFTRSDASKLKAELVAELRDPPRWLVNDLQHLRKEISDIELETRRLQIQIDALDPRPLKGKGEHYVPPRQ